MPEVYKKMYAILVGCVDSLTNDLVNIALLEHCDKDRVLKVAKDLQQALRDTEEIYLEAADEE